MANIKENKRFHFTYKTTNLINGRYYLGMHSTNRLDDGYLGSGKRLYYELNKYGRDNFKFEILKQFESREQLVQAEIKLITEHDLKNPNCLNCKPGGEGGFLDSTRMDNAERKRRFLDKMSNDSEYREGFLDKCRENYPKTLGKYKALGTHDYATFKGKKHTPETIEKMKESKKDYGKGSTNSQYGTCWITNEVENKKIYKGDSIPQGWKLGRKLK
jgi:hypothetical protein